MAEWTAAEEMAAALVVKDKFPEGGGIDGACVAIMKLQCEVTALREALENLRSVDECACLDNDDYCPHAIAYRLLTKIPK